MEIRMLIAEFDESWEEFDTDLRMHRGFNEAAYKRCCAALSQLAVELKSENSVPKELAMTFVDLVSAIEGCRDIYKGSLDEKIFQAMDELGDLARSCCVVVEKGP